MPRSNPTPPALATSPLDGLLAVAAALRTSPELEPTLQASAASIAASLRVATVAINLYRPAYDDFKTVVVHGADAARDLLLGSVSPAEEWALLTDERFARRGAYFIPEGAFDWKRDSTPSYVPPIPPSEDPDAWRAEDALFVPLRSSAGLTLGILSIDEPESGRRPTDPDLDVLAGVAAQAGLAIESAQHAEAARRHRADVQHLLRVSSRITSEHSRAGIAGAVCEGIRDALGFERVALVLRDGWRDRFAPAAAIGWPPCEPAGHWSAADLLRLLDGNGMQDGCLLLTREDAHARTPPHMHGVYSSRRNGRGPHGWNHHWLLVPLHDEEGALIGVVWPDDPSDRLLPTLERLRTLRAFANQAASALEAATARERLAHLAEHDPLTGLRNRRHLHAAIDAAIEASAPAGTALVVTDLDAFKRINDELGSFAGDVVLRDVARAITDALPPGGLGARLGGGEFAMVLPRTGAAGARLAAEALRREVAARTDVPWVITLSAGLAVTGEDLGDAHGLLRAATRALSAAKRLGRDRVVVYDPETLKSLLEALDRDDFRGGHHLSAVLLLAETLDLRDPGTARHSQTVGAYARAIATAIELPPDRVERLKVAGLLHDIGKLAVSDAILHKAGPLDAHEREEVRRHCQVGARILNHAGLGDIASWVLAHHERWSGGGYPHGLDGTAIPLEARILSVADAYEAMTASRPYRTLPLTAAAAQAELRRHAGMQFDPLVVDAFLAVPAL